MQIELAGLTHLVPPIGENESGFEISKSYHFGRSVRVTADARGRYLAQRRTV
jgi:hypothetical protein